MRHAAHKANKGSVQRTSFGVISLLPGSRTRPGPYVPCQAANGDAVALAIDPVFAAKLNEVAR